METSITIPPENKTLMPSQAFFITGTDTEVGKTYATCALLHRFRQQGFSAVGLKPVAAGVDAAGKNEDVEALRAASSVALPERVQNPYLFAPPIAPHIAAREAGVEIRFSPLCAALTEATRQADRVLVEGVGGFRVPLGPEGDSADLAAALNLPIILVVGMRLGCISHALLTAEAIAARQLPLMGWIANTLVPALPRFDNNLATLTQHLPAPCLGLIPYASPGGPAEAAHCLKLP
jgi:dethiobiotin synthetase